MRAIKLFVVAATLGSLIVSIAVGANIEVTLVDLDGNGLKSNVAGATNDVRIVEMSRDSNLVFNGADIDVQVRSGAPLGRKSGGSNVLTIPFTPPSDSVAFLIVARRFDEARPTTAVPFVVNADSSEIQKITIAVPRATSYRAMP